MREAWLTIVTHERSRYPEEVGKIRVEGLDQPLATQVAGYGDVIVLKVPGHNYWSGRGEQSYAPAEYQVWQWIDGQLVGTHGKARRLIDFPVTQRKEQVR